MYDFQGPQHLSLPLLYYKYLQNIFINILYEKEHYSTWVVFITYTHLERQLEYLFGHRTVTIAMEPLGPIIES